jgi:hypothetical protein
MKSLTGITAVTQYTLLNTLTGFARWIGDHLMARKWKLNATEQTAVTLEELPRDTEELTGEEAEAAKGGWFAMFGAGAAAALAQQQAENDAIPTWEEIEANNP